MNCPSIPAENRPGRAIHKEGFIMTIIDALAVAYAQEKMHLAMQEGKSDEECMTILKAAYSDAALYLAKAFYFDEEE